MPDETFSVSFAPEALSEIAQFAGFPTLLSEEVQHSFEDSGSALVASIRGSMHWKAPTGELEDSIHAVQDSPYELQVGSDDPKARRRNWGFSGMTDSLGRYYANDPGAYFMESGLADQQSAILASIDQAVEHALNRLGTS